MAFTEAPVKTYAAGEALKLYARVKKAGDTVVTAGLGAADTAIGIVHSGNQNSGENTTVRLLSGTGSAFMIANGVIAQNAPVYGAASGKVSATVSGAIIGYAEQASGADGDIIEVLLAGKIN